MALCGRARVADGSRKETKTQREQNPIESVRAPVGFAVGGSPLECNRRVWFIAVVLKLMSRPLHHTLREYTPCSSERKKMDRAFE